MKFKEVIIVVLIMLICAMLMLAFMIFNDTIEVSDIPIVGNIIENVANSADKAKDGNTKQNIANAGDTNKNETSHSEQNNKQNNIENGQEISKDKNTESQFGTQQDSEQKNQEEQANNQNSQNQEPSNEQNKNQEKSDAENNQEQPEEPDYNFVAGNYTDVNQTVYATTNVNIRAFDNASCDKKGLLNEASSITRTGIGDNGWSRVEYNGEVAYIASNYLTTQKPPEKVAVEIPIGNRKIDPSKPMVALTFDDGPNGTATPKILDTLEKYKVVATFFDLGTCMANYPSITKREEKIGCEVGSHTYSHQNLNKLSASEIKDDILHASRIYENTLGHKMYLVRPPYGNANSTVKGAMQYPLIGWDVDSLDWKSRNKDKIISKINETSNFDGRIILMHSIYNSTAEAVEELVPQLLSQGYQLVTVSEMAKYKGATLRTGTMYYNFR